MNFSKRIGRSASSYFYLRIQIPDSIQGLPSTLQGVFLRPGFRQFPDVLYCSGSRLTRSGISYGARGYPPPLQNSTVNDKSTSCSKCEGYMSASKHRQLVSSACAWTSQYFIRMRYLSPSWRRADIPASGGPQAGTTDVCGCIR